MAKSLEATWGRTLQGAAKPKGKAETRKEVDGNEIRSNYYECSDSLYGLMEAVDRDSATKEDKPLKAAVKELEEALDKVYDLLTAGYLWD